MAIEKQVNVVISAVDKYTAGLKSFSGGLGQMGMMAGVAEAALVALSLAAAGVAIAIGKNLLDAAADFHDGAINVHAVAQSMGTSLGTINEILDDLTLRFPLTGKQAADALESIAQMGFGTEAQLKKVSEAAVNLSMATGTDMQTSVKALTATMNVFGMEVGEAERLMNALAQAQFSSAMTVSDYAEAIKHAGAMSSVTGQSFEGMLASMALLKGFGLEASQTATTMRMALGKLMKQSDDGAASLKKYGLTYKDVNPEMNSFAEIIGKFEGQMVGATDAMNIFGIRQIPFVKLINMGADEFIAYRDSLKGTEAGFDAVTAKMKTWENVNKQVEGSMDLMKKTLSGDLLPAVVEFIGTDAESGLRGIISEFTKLEKENPFTGIGEIVTSTFNQIKGIGTDIFRRVFGDVEGLYDGVLQLFNFLETNLVLVTTIGGAFFESFSTGAKEGDNLKMVLGWIKNALMGALGAVAGLHDAFALLWWGIEWGGTIARRAFNDIMLGISKANLALLKIGDAVVPFSDFSRQIKETEADIVKYGKASDAVLDPKKPKFWLGAVVDAGVKANEVFEDFGETGAAATKKVSDGAAQTAKNLAIVEAKAKESQEAMSKIGAMDTVDLEEYNDIITDAIDGTSKLAEKTGELEEKSKDAFGNYIDGVMESEKGTRRFTDEVIGAGTEIVKTKEELDKIGTTEIKFEKEQFEHDLKIIELKTKTTSDILKKSLDIALKLDLKQMDLAMEKIKADVKVFESLTDSIEATSKAAASMFSDLSSFEGSLGQRWALEDTLQQQMDMQQDLVDSQVKLVDQQAALAKQREAAQRIQNEQAQKDGGLRPIEVTVAGDVKPWLKGLMQELMDEVFVQARAEAFSCQCETL